MRPPLGKDPRHAFLRLAPLVATLTLALPPVAAADGAGGGGSGGPTATARPAVVHLTFDDGPDPRWTPQVLTVLRRHGARATFFVVGSSARAHPALLRRIVREGHGLGNHTYSHADLTLLSPARFFREVDATEAVVHRLTGRRTRLLRPPYGAATADTRRLAARRGYRLALWTVDPQDWRRPGAAAIAAHVVARTHRGDVVLLHDGGGDRSQTVAALDRAVATLTARGYTFAPLR